MCVTAAVCFVFFLVVLLSFVIILRTSNSEGTERVHYFFLILNQVTQADRLQVEYGVCISYIPARSSCHAEQGWGMGNTCECP